MGLIQYIPQSGNPETPGQKAITGGNVLSMSVSTSVITINYDDAGATSITFTYSSTGGNQPSDAELFEAWAAVVGAANGAAGPAINAPQFYDDTDVAIYPAVA